MPITLFFDAKEGINWEIGEPATKLQLETGIKECGGQRLPSGILPALDPGDVVILREGVFWITRDWELKSIVLSSMSIEEQETLISVLQQILTNPGQQCWGDVINQFILGD